MAGKRAVPSPRDDAAPEPKPHGAGHEPNAGAALPPRTPQASFSIKRCTRPELLLRGMIGGITFGHGGVEYYALADGRLFRMATEDEEPHAIYPKATDRYPGGVPLRAMALQELTDAEYRRQLEQLPEPVTGLGKRGPDWSPRA